MNSFLAFIFDYLIISNHFYFIFIMKSFIISLSDLYDFVKKSSTTITNKEGYYLFNDESIVYISASTRSGLFYGLQSFLQLLPSEIYSQSVVTSNITWSTPIVQVVDYPRFEWRGFMIDSARHFFNVLLDLFLSQLKLNAKMELILMDLSIFIQLTKIN